MGQSGKTDHTDTSTPGPSRAGADDRVRQDRGDLRRQQILDAAVTLFARHGYEGTGVAALADEVGMTAPGLLYYFGTKERLLREVVAERDHAERDDLGALAGTGIRSLRGIGRANADHETLTKLYVRLGAENLTHGDPLHLFFQHRYETGRAFIRDILVEAQRAGSVRGDVDIDQIASEALATLMGLEIQWLSDPERVDLAATVETYFDRLADELAPQPNNDPVTATVSRLFGTLFPSNPKDDHDHG